MDLDKKENKRNTDYLYRKNNKEKIKQKYKEYYLIHKDKVKEKSREYYKNNKEKRKNTDKKNWHRRVINWIRKRKQKVDINSDFLLELFKKQEGKCYWFGVDLVTDSIIKHPFQPSVDRLDNSKGYERDNVVISSLIANLSRSDFDQGLWKDAIDNIRNNNF
jgi:hypothetical protein